MDTNNTGFEDAEETDEGRKYGKGQRRQKKDESSAYFSIRPSRVTCMAAAHSQDLQRRLLHLETSLLLRLRMLAVWAEVKRAARRQT